MDWITKIEKIFAPPQFAVHYSEFTNKYTIYNGGTVLNLGEVENPNICVELEIYKDNTAYISYLQKCIVSGKTSLELLDRFFIANNIVHVDLQDASTLIYCNNKLYIDLAILSILSKGISWYNQYGYVSDNYAEERSHNMALINRNMNEYLHDILENNKIKDWKKDRKMSRFATLKPQIMEGLHHIPINPNDTVQQYFTKIVQMLKHETDYCLPKYIWLDKFIDFIRAFGYVKHTTKVSKSFVKTAGSKPKTKKYKQLRRKSKTRR